MVNLSVETGRIGKTKNIIITVELSRSGQGLTRLVKIPSGSGAWSGNWSNFVWEWVGLMKHSEGAGRIGKKLEYHALASTPFVESYLWDELEHSLCTRPSRSTSVTNLTNVLVAD